MSLSKACKKCAVETDDVDSSNRCKECRTFAVRISRALAAQSDDWRTEWAKVDTTVFAQKAKTLYGEDLVKIMEDMMDETHTDEAFACLTGTGNFLDEADMREKYASKPARLEAILKNARRFKCPVSETEMIEDMVYQSTQRNTQKRVHERILSCKTPAVTIKRRKTSKPTPKEPGEDPTHKPLSVKNKEALTKQIESMPKMEQDLIELTAAMEAEESKPWAELLPGYVVASLKGAQAKVMTHKTDIELKIANDACDMKTMNVAWKELKEHLKEVKRRALVQAAEAKKMVANVS